MGVSFGFVVLVYLRKIRPNQLWVELSWVVAISSAQILTTNTKLSIIILHTDCFYKYYQCYHETYIIYNYL